MIVLQENGLFWLALARTAVEVVTMKLTFTSSFGTEINMRIRIIKH